MSRFVNTVDGVGDDALTDSIIQRSISGAFNDNRITKIGNNAFRYCQSLTSVNFPSVVIIDTDAFAWCTKLNTVDLAAIERIFGNAFGWAYALTTMIIRNTTKVCTLSGGFDSSSPLAKGTGQIYVPTSLLDEYKSATNWSAYASQLLALEEWTDDGTVYGDLVSYMVSYRLSFVTSSNTVGKIGNRYTATLTADTEIEEVSITMGGVDITAEVYNAETGEINIPLVTGDLVITAKAQAPASGDGDLPDGYTALTYIASTTTVTGANAISGAYIDTGIFPSDTLSIECNMAALGTSSEFSGIGAVETNSKGWIRAGSYATGTLMSMFCAGSRNGVANIPFDNDFHTFFLENGHQSIDGANDTYLTGSPTFTSSARIYLFAAWIGFAATQVYKTAISWCKIRENGELIKDYVACIRDSDGAIGMYDRATGEFVGNSGSGSFTAGDVISGVVPLHSFTAATATPTSWVDEADDSYQFDFSGSPAVADGLVKFTASSYGVLNKAMAMPEGDMTFAMKARIDTTPPSANGESWIFGTPTWSDGLIFGIKGGNIVLGSNVTESGEKVLCAATDDYSVYVCKYVAAESTSYWYVNSVLVTSYSGSSITRWLNNVWWLNRLSDATAYGGDNEIEYLKFFDFALSEGEIAALT